MGQLARAIVGSGCPGPHPNRVRTFHRSHATPASSSLSLPSNLISHPLIGMERGTQSRSFSTPHSGRNNSGTRHETRLRWMDAYVVRRRQRPSFRIEATNNISSGEPQPVQLGGWQVSQRDLKVFAAAISTIILATANKVLYKMALIPMKEYPFFLAQLNTFGYVLVYFAILYSRYKAGIVTDEMLNVPKRKFVATGALEALGLATGMAGAAVLPGASIPVLLQVFLVWQLLLSAILLGKRYTPGQLAGCVLVVVGVLFVVASGGGAESVGQTGVFWPLVMILSALFSSAASILKEGIFSDAERELKGKNLDIFVVNSFGSGYQALFVLLFLPFLSSIRGIPFNQLGGYFKDGAACFLNAGAPIACEGSPLVPLLYVVCNMSFNIVSLYLMKISSAIVSSLTSTAAVPLSIWAFTFRLPYLGAPAPLPPQLTMGSAILIGGLALYNASNPAVQEKLKTTKEA